MGKFDDLKGDPTEYNPDRVGGNGEVSLEGADDTEPDGDQDNEPNKKGRKRRVTRFRTIPSWHSDVSWGDDCLWFDCPICGERLSSRWFWERNSQCEGCNAIIDIDITVKKVETRGDNNDG